MYRMLKNRFFRSVTWIVTLAFVATLIPTGLFAEPKPTKRKVVYGNSFKKKAEAVKAAPDVQAMSKSEMAAIKGKGPYRNEYLAGTMPWHRTYHDVNMCTGNLMKSFTDVQVAPARGAGLVLQRTYNSQDDRVGPFGRGWSHAYDIRMKEAGDNKVDRVDFFSGRHTYKRDADGLYTPPPYSHDWMVSDYKAVLTVGPTDVNSDTQTGLDGTKKHFILMGNERVIDYIEDRNGNQTTFAYDANDLLSTVTDPSGRELEFTWTNYGDAQNPIWRITQVTGPLQTVSYVYYQSSGETGSGGEAYNLKQAIVDPGQGNLNRTTTFTYTTFTDGIDTEYGLLASITDSAGHVVSYQYGYPQYNFTGAVWVTQITEPAGVDTNNNPRTSQIAIALVNALGQRSASIGFPYTWYITVNCDSMLRSESLYMREGYFTTAYDSSNNVTQTAKGSIGVFMLNDGIDRTWARADNYTYGPHGHVLTHGVEGFEGEDTYTYYDESKYFQKATVTDMEGNVSSFDYGATTDANAGNRGNVLWAKDARYGTTNQKFEYTYNSYGQKTSETNLNDVVTNYTYGDQWGNLTQVEQDPSGLDRTTAMTYDAAGRVLTKTDPSGRTSEIEYNACGQPTTAEFPATYDQYDNEITPAETVAYTYGDNGRVEAVDDNHGTTTIGYETGSDRVSSVDDENTGTISYTYGVSGEILSKTLPGGGTWRYTYGWCMSVPKDDPNSWVPTPTSMKYDVGGVYSRQVDYDTDCVGNLWRVTFDKQYSGQDVVAYAQTHYNYDNVYDDGGYNEQSTHLWLRKVKTTWHYKTGPNTWSAKDLSQNEYTHDAVGNRLTNEITLRDNNDQESTRTEEYAYDDLYRLTSVDYDDGQTQGYTFDPMGNRTQKTDSQSGQEDYVYNNANMLLEREGNYYTNDANGNTLTGGGRTNVWDSQNRLYSTTSAGTTTSFAYGYDGLRRSVAVSGGTTTHYALDGQNVAREGTVSGGTFTPTATYLNGLRGTECRADDSTGQVRWYLFDGLGSVLGEIADPDGNNNPVKCTRKMDVYGAQRASSGTAQSNHKFSGSLGHSSDPTTGLIYMRARYMDPVMGRFVSEDPGQAGTNWYVYCSNNPVNRTDQSGKVDNGAYLGLLGLALMASGMLLIVYSNAIGPLMGIGLGFYAYGVYALCIAMAGNTSPMGVLSGAVAGDYGSDLVQRFLPTLLPTLESTAAASFITGAAGKGLCMAVGVYVGNIAANIISTYLE